MKLGMPMVVAICSSLSITPVAAADGGEAALGSASGGAAGVAVGKQTGEDLGAMVGDAEGGSLGAAVTTTEKGKTGTVVDGGRTHGATAGKAKRASTATAAGHIYDQVQKGNIQIQGATDADIYE